MSKDIIRMAKKAGIDFDLIEENESHWYLTTGGMERFAELVRADEREACLDLAESYAKNNTELRDAIRARGNK